MIRDGGLGGGREVRREKEEVTEVKRHVTMTSCIVRNILQEVWKSDPANSIQSTPKYTQIYTHTQKKTSSEVTCWIHQSWNHPGISLAQQWNINVCIGFLNKKHTNSTIQTPG